MKKCQLADVLSSPPLLAQFMLEESSFLYRCANFAPSAYVALEDMVGVTKPLKPMWRLCLRIYSCCVAVSTRNALPCDATPVFKALYVLRRADELACFSDLNKVLMLSKHGEANKFDTSFSFVGCSCILLKIHRSVLLLQYVCVVHLERMVGIVVINVQIPFHNVIFLAKLF